MATRRECDGEKAKVLVVDDHPIIRRGIAQLLRKTDDLVMTHEAQGATEALESLKAARIDMVVLDLSLKDGSGMSLIRQINSHYPHVRVLVLSMHDEVIYAERVLRAGAHGYVMKEEATERVIDALRRILGGEVYVSDRLTSRLLSKAVRGQASGPKFPVESLTDRELEIFEMFGQGVSARQLAEKLALSIKTVEVHRENIKRKLRLSTSGDVLRHAIEWVQSGRSV